MLIISLGGYSIFLSDLYLFSSKTLGHVCLHVEAIRNKEASYRGVLPEYSCLVLSPANLWQQDVQRFAEDSSLLTTIFNQHVSFFFVILDLSSKFRQIKCVNRQI